MVVAECKLRGSGATPLRLGLFHVSVSVERGMRDGHMGLDTPIPALGTILMVPQHPFSLVVKCSPETPMGHLLTSLVAPRYHRPHLSTWIASTAPSRLSTLVT